jgi:tetratricopeptide (TPR) repeat protein
LAPFCGRIREDFEWALEQQVDQLGPMRKRKRAAVMEEREQTTRRAATAGRTALTELDEDEAPPARRAPSRRREFGPYVPKLALAGSLAILVTAAGLGIAWGATKMIGSLLAVDPSTRITAMADSPASLPDELRLAMMQAETELTARNPAKAVEIYRAARTAHPGHVQAVEAGLVLALRALGATEKQNRRFEAAANAYREAAQLDPLNPNNWSELGTSLREHSRTTQVANDVSRRRTILDEAEQAYQRALKINPTDAESLYGLAQVFTARNDRRRATETFERLVALAPSTREGRLAQQSLAELRKN